MLFVDNFRAGVGTSESGVALLGEGPLINCRRRLSVACRYYTLNSILNMTRGYTPQYSSRRCYKYRWRSPRRSRSSERFDPGAEKAYRGKPSSDTSVMLTPSLLAIYLASTSLIEVCLLFNHHVHV